jgi:hypothetical protein
MDTLESSYQIERKVAGSLLAAGSITFLVAAFIPITDKAGTLIYALPTSEWPAVISDNSTAWAWIGTLFIVSVLVTVFGTTLISDGLRRMGDRLFSRLGNLAMVFASILLLFDLTFRVSNVTWAQEAASNPFALDLYIRISEWLQVIFMTYSVLMIVALAAYGIAILQTNMAPRWSGWILLTYTLLAVLYVLLTSDFPPFFHYLMLLMLGVLLILPPGNLSFVKHTAQPLIPLPEKKV